jgi:predicted  nucleic acid-binding Zn-ribbon protein
MINKGSGLENNLEELKDIDEKMSHYDVMIKNLTEQNRALQHEMQLLHKQKCDLTQQLKVLTEENKVLQNEIPQLQNKQLELTNQLKVIKQITEPY